MTPPPSELVMRYIELKSGHSDDGPAWIGYVAYSRSGRSVYFNGHAFKRLTGGGPANYYDIESAEGYWISGVKARGSNRHPAGGRGRITIEARCVAEYLAHTGASSLDMSTFVVSDGITPPNPEQFHQREHQSQRPPTS